MILIVCGLSPLPEVIAARRPSHVITLLDPATLIETPQGIAPERHLRLGVNDISEPIEGMVPPDEARVHRIHGLSRASGIPGPGQDRPALRDGIYLAFGIACGPER